VGVSLFDPCFVDQLTPQVGLATVKVLKRLGPKELCLVLVG
jgi:Fe-S oxidoreductase